MYSDIFQVVLIALLDLSMNFKLKSTIYDRPDAFKQTDEIG